MIFSETTLGEGRGEEKTWGQVILGDWEKRMCPQRSQESDQWGRRTVRRRCFSLKPSKESVSRKKWWLVSAVAERQIRFWPSSVLRIGPCEDRAYTLRKAGSVWKTGEKSAWSRLKRQWEERQWRCRLWRSFAARGSRIEEVEREVRKGFLKTMEVVRPCFYFDGNNLVEGRVGHVRKRGSHPNELAKERGMWLSSGEADLGRACSAHHYLRESQ